MTRTRIAIVAPSTVVSSGPVADVFEELWPQADPVNIVDDSLFADYSSTRIIDDNLARRLDSLLRHSELSGAKAAVFTGSVFGAVVAQTRKTMGIPVLASYEAMIEAAFEAGPRLCVLTTSPFAMKNITADIERFAARNGRTYAQESIVLDDARIAFREKGDIVEHFRLIAAAVDRMTGFDAVLLGQTSMDTAFRMARPHPLRPVLTPLRTTVVKLRKMLKS